MSVRRTTAGTTRRRIVLLIAAVFAASLYCSTAVAGSYLERVRFLMAQSDGARDFLRSHLRDRQLAQLIQREAEGRLRGAKATLVPEQVVMAHPHLLLMLEKFERAASAAAAGDLKRYYRTQKQANDEADLFRSILLQLGWQLPTKKRSRGGP